VTTEPKDETKEETTFTDVGYFDPVELKEMLCCDRCGSLVLPVAAESHRILHLQLDLALAQGKLALDKIDFYNGRKR
jgi:hypothetical protein